MLSKAIGLPPGDPRAVWHAASPQAATAASDSERPVLPQLVMMPPRLSFRAGELCFLVGSADHEVQGGHGQGLGAMLADKRGAPERHRRLGFRIHQDHV